MEPLHTLPTAATLGTVSGSLELAARRLAGHSESPRLDAELLLCKITGLSRAGLIVHGAAPLDADGRAAFDALISRRAGGAPVAYLTGRREFWSLGLAVTPAVLVPRPETELLVEQALALLPDAPRSLLDLGTGSGAIALAIASERPRTRITAVDLSAAALDVARHNAVTLGLPDIDWRLGSWFGAVADERFDLIVANPPYVAAGDPALSRLAAEPLLALTPGPTGLEALTAIIDAAAAHLEPRGWLLLEHGNEQADAVTRLLEGAGFTGVRTVVDPAGRPRITLGAVAPGLVHSLHHSSQ
jgi:release factor glutamine methyltransferase